MNPIRLTRLYQAQPVEKPVGQLDETVKLISSSAITTRPRDASCLSVVTTCSFNSAKRRAQSFTVSYVGYRLNQ